jgi:hypothetical protein
VLLEAGADRVRVSYLEAASLNGKTPLLLAIYHGHTAVVRVLWQFEQRRATPQPLPAAQETGTRLSTLEAADSAAELEQARQFEQRRATRSRCMPRMRWARLSMASLARLFAAAGRSDEQRGEHTCVVCIDATTDHAVIPCGHVCLCSTCGPRLARTRHARCPICREPVQSLQKLFFP